MVRETRYLWVGNLPENVTEKQIGDHFQRHGKIQSVKLSKDNDSPSATVAFMDIKSASKAHSETNDIGGVTVQTEYSEPTATGSKITVTRIHDPESQPRGYTSQSRGGQPGRFPSRTDGFEEDRNFSGNYYEQRGQYENRRPSYEEDGFRRKGSFPSQTSRGGAYTRPQYDSREGAPAGRQPSYDSQFSSGPPDTQQPRGRTKQRVSHSPARSTSSGATPSRPRLQSQVGFQSKSPSAKSRSRSSSTSSSGSSKSSRSPSGSKTSKSKPKEHGPPKEGSLGTCGDGKGKLGILIRGLPIRSSDTSLRDGLFHEYKKFGKVTSVHVFGQGEERYAIVSFKKVEDAGKAFESSQGKKFFGSNIVCTTHEGFEADDADFSQQPDMDEYHPKSTRTLFVGNLHQDTSVQELRETFKEFGEIIDIDIKKQTTSTAYPPLSYGFVQFTDITSVVKALKKMDSEHIGPNKIKLGFGKSMPTNVVWLDNLAETVRDGFLVRQFARFGPVNCCIIDRNKGQALVYYEDMELAQIGVNEMRGRILDGKKIQLDFASRDCQTLFLDSMERSGQLRAADRPDERGRGGGPGPPGGFRGGFQAGFEDRYIVGKAPAPGTAHPTPPPTKELHNKASFVGSDVEGHYYDMSTFDIYQDRMQELSFYWWVMDEVGDTDRYVFQEAKVERHPEWTFQVEEDYVDLDDSLSSWSDEDVTEKDLPVKEGTGKDNNKYELEDISSGGEEFEEGEITEGKKDASGSNVYVIGNGADKKVENQSETEKMDITTGVKRTSDKMDVPEKVKKVKKSKKARNNKTGSPTEDVAGLPEIDSEPSNHQVVLGGNVEIENFENDTEVHGVNIVSGKMADGKPAKQMDTNESGTVDIVAQRSESVLVRQQMAEPINIIPNNNDNVEMVDKPKELNNMDKINSSEGVKSQMVDSSVVGLNEMGSVLPDSSGLGVESLAQVVDSETHNIFPVPSMNPDLESEMMALCSDPLQMGMEVDYVQPEAVTNTVVFMPKNVDVVTEEVAAETKPDSTVSVQEGVESVVSVPKGGESTVSVQEGLESIVSVQEKVESTVPIQEGVQSTVSVQEGVESTVPVQEGVESTISIQEGVNSNVSVQEEVESTISIQEGVDSNVQEGIDSNVSVQEGVESTISIQEDSNVPVQEGVESTVSVLEGVENSVVFMPNNEGGATEEVMLETETESTLRAEDLALCSADLSACFDGIDPTETPPNKDNLNNGNEMDVDT